MGMLKVIPNFHFKIEIDKNKWIDEGYCRTHVVHTKFD
jgi:hypothetical protein